MKKGSKELLEEVLTARMNKILSGELEPEVAQKEMEALAKLYRLKTDEFNAESEDLERSMRRVMDQERNENDVSRLLEERTQEAKIAQDQLTEAKKDRLWKTATNLLEIFVPAALYGMLWFTGLEYEETGRISSNFVRGLIQKVRPSR